MPKLRKWPFILADLALCAGAAYVLEKTLPPDNAWEGAVCLGALGLGALGAWLWIKPFLMEHQAELKSVENQELATAVEQIKSLQAVGRQIVEATGAWQKAQELSGNVLKSAAEMQERMNAEAVAFKEFMQRSQDQEKATLRLEAEKLRRGEGEWLQVVVLLLDHVYALTSAAERSGQENVIQQLRQFQAACRDAARRIGLVPYMAERGDAFDDRGQVWNKEGSPPPGSKVAATLATGYTFQGQLVRKALVALEQETEPTSA